MGRVIDLIEKEDAMDICEIAKHKEQIASEVHNAWWREKLKQGFHAPLECPVANGPKFEPHCKWCHTDMYPYDELAEHIKDYDRATVQAVLDAIEKINFPPGPVT